MIKKVLALCDGEEDYLCHMADYLERKEMLPFAVHAFTDTEQLRKFAEEEENKIEILLIAESAYKAGDEDYPAVQVIVLNESGSQVGEKVENISKYQSTENIYRAVMSNYSGSGREIARRISTGHQMKIIGNYTPVGRCMQTTFALSMGQILAKKHKTLYLNFETCSGLGYLLNRDFSADITDVLYYLNGEREKLAYRLGGMVQNLNGLDYIPPVAAYEDLREISAEQWIDLFREIERSMDYEYLILDLSEAVGGLFQILRECFRVFTIVREDGFAEAKLRQYEAMLQAGDYEDVAAKTKKRNLPVFHKIPAGLDQLTHGDAAAYIRKVIEEDIYECAG